MNKTRKIIIGLGVACCATFAFAGCATLDMTIPNLIGDGFSVVVEFDQNGGVIASQNNMYLQDLYSSEQLEEGIQLLEPGDSRRGSVAGPMSSVSREGYFLIGWYQTRAPRTDEAGNMLNEYGEICTDPEEQGYTYTGLWDFSKDTLEKGMTHEATMSGKKVQKFTLYAAWSPDYTYAFYRPETVEGKTTWVEYGSATLPANSQSIAVPAYSDETGKLEYGSVAEYKTDEERFTLTGIYADEALADPYAVYAADTTENLYKEEIVHPGHSVGPDLETGTAANTVLKLYTTWQKGLYYRVTGAKNFADNMLDSAGKGHFIFKNDIDFNPVTDEETGATTQIAWSASLMEFSGVIEGNGYTVKGISSTQSDYDNDVAGGVFGSIAASAEIADLKFEAVKFTLNNATRYDRGLYGMLAGRVDAGATLKNVSITGELHIGNPYPEGIKDTDGNIVKAPYENYTIGLICGNMANNAAVSGMSWNGVTVVLEKLSFTDPVTFEYIVGGWPVKATVNENGTLTLTRNDDPMTDPN